MKRTSLAILLFLSVLTHGCASLQNKTVARVDDRVVEYAIAGSGSPVVVFENGLGGSMDWWAKVFPEISKDTTAFAYNRPGYGKSDPVSTPRDGKHVVDELRSLLRHQGLNPPYVLVGHSLGGLYMQLYARSYPDEVGALVLVDSTHPAQLKGAGAPENWPAWVRTAVNVTTSSVAKDELKAIDATGDDVLALPTFTGKPVIVLTALEPMKQKSPLADDQNEKRKDMPRLYPGSKLVWVDSDHGIPLSKPEAVISVIRDVITTTYRPDRGRPE